MFGEIQKPAHQQADREYPGLDQGVMTPGVWLFELEDGRLKLQDEPSEKTALVVACFPGWGASSRQGRLTVSRLDSDNTLPDWVTGTVCALTQVQTPWGTQFMGSTYRLGDRTEPTMAGPGRSVGSIAGLSGAFERGLQAPVQEALAIIYGPASGAGLDATESQLRRALSELHGLCSMSSQMREQLAIFASISVISPTERAARGTTTSHQIMIRGEDGAFINAPAPSRTRRGANATSESPSSSAKGFADRLAAANRNKASNG